MTIAYWCVLIAIFLPYLFTMYAKYTGSGYNLQVNHAPREFMTQLTGARKRADWAQLNMFEALPGFIGAVIISHLAGAAQGSIDQLAIAYIILRIFHGIFYIADLAVLRTLIWGCSLACIIALFVIAA